MEHDRRPRESGIVNSNEENHLDWSDEFKGRDDAFLDKRQRIRSVRSRAFNSQSVWKTHKIRILASEGETGTCLQGKANCQLRRRSQHRNVSGRLRVQDSDNHRLPTAALVYRYASVTHKAGVYMIRSN